MEKTNIFIAYLRHRLVFEEPTSLELTNILDKEISEINITEERVLLLTGILKLLESDVINTYYKGGIMDFKNYAEYKLNKEKVVSEDSWDELYSDLSGKYINGVNPSDFNEVMNHKRLPGGKNKIIWLRKKTEALYFQEQMGFTMPQFNDCFVWIEKTKFAEKNRHGNPNVEFVELIEKHKR